MNGKTTKYYKYDSTSGRITIPSAIAESLGWKHKEEIIIKTKVFNGQIGLFLYKKQ